MIFNRKIIGIAALIGSIFVFGGGKASEFVSGIQSSIKQIQYRVIALKNLDWIGGLTNPRIRFKFDMELLNPTATNFNFNAGSTIRIKKIIFKDKNGLPLVTTLPSINSINLPSNGKQLVKDIPGEIPVKKLGVAFDTFTQLKPGQLNMDVFIDVAGREFMLNRV